MGAMHADELAIDAERIEPVAPSERTAIPLVARPEGFEPPTF